MQKIKNVNKRKEKLEVACEWNDRRWPSVPDMYDHPQQKRQQSASRQLETLFWSTVRMPWPLSVLSPSSSLWLFPLGPLMFVRSATHLTMLGCLSSLRSEISRIAVQGTYWHQRGHKQSYYVSFFVTVNKECNWEIPLWRSRETYSFFFVVQTNTLEGNDIVRFPVLGLVDDTIGT